MLELAGAIAAPAAERRERRHQRGRREREAHPHHLPVGESISTAPISRAAGEVGIHRDPRIPAGRRQHRRRGPALAAEVIRSGLTGLAVWWTEHPEVTREQIVRTAVNVLWVGFERVSSGDAGAEPG